MTMVTTPLPCTPQPAISLSSVKSRRPAPDSRPQFTQRSQRILEILLVVGLTMLGFLAMGYHPGYEDDGVYLAAVKAQLNPALFPHDAAFFRLQMQATLFDTGMAHFIRLTEMPVSWAELLWQWISLFLTLWASEKIARQIFGSGLVRWAGVATVGAMFTLPIAGTALNLMDQHLHPRNLATALIMISVSQVLAGKRWQPLSLMIVAALIHPIMAAFGLSFCGFLMLASRWMLAPREAGQRSFRSQWSTRVASLAITSLPLRWVFEPPSDIWRKALDTRTYCFLNRWAWYELVGAVAPLLIFWLLWRMGRKQGLTKLTCLTLAAMLFGIFQLGVAILIQSVPSLIRLIPLQPMRFLQLTYLFMLLLGGCLAGKYLLRSSWWRWALFLLLLYGGMFIAQRQLLDSSEHLELPGQQSANSWIQTFTWIRQHTPSDAYFALDPKYLSAPGEDYHSFRALAERSQLSDGIKDTAVVTQVPELGPLWQSQLAAQQGWAEFKLADFERLRADWGVDWVVVAYPQTAGLDCVWRNRALWVCRIPFNARAAKAVPRQNSDLLSKLSR